MFRHHPYYVYPICPTIWIKKKKKSQATLCQHQNRHTMGALSGWVVGRQRKQGKEQGKTRTQEHDHSLQQQGGLGGFCCLGFTMGSLGLQCHESSRLFISKAPAKKSIPVVTHKSVGTSSLAKCVRATPASCWAWRGCVSWHSQPGTKCDAPGSGPSLSFPSQPQPSSSVK